MDMPKLSKEYMMGWISKCNKFFDLDGILEEDKVVIVSLALDEASYQWFQGSKSSRDNGLTWDYFVEAIKVRFGSLYDNPMEELVKLKKTKNLIEFQENFEKLACKI